MSSAESGLRIPYAFLFDISGRFRATYGERGKLVFYFSDLQVNTAPAMAMNDTFSRVIKDRMVRKKRSFESLNPNRIFSITTRMLTKYPK